MNKGLIIYRQNGDDFSSDSFKFVAVDPLALKSSPEEFVLRRKNVVPTRLEITSSSGHREVRLVDSQPGGKDDRFRVSWTNSKYIVQDSSGRPIYVMSDVAGVGGSGTNRIEIPDYLLKNQGPLRLALGAGDDQVVLATGLFHADKTLFTVDFGAGVDSLVSPLASASTPNIWTVTDPAGGSLERPEFGRLRFTGLENWNGSTGPDRFVIASLLANGLTLDGGPGAAIDSLTMHADVDMTLTNSRFTIHGTTDRTLRIGGIETAILEGGPGDNRLDASMFNRPVTLRGNPGNDVLLGGASYDRLEGHAGNDLLVGGAGNDRLLGYDGDDVLQGGLGNDRLEGGFGHDALVGGLGDDTLIGLDGRDLLIGGVGADQLNGGNGEDILIDGETYHDDRVATLRSFIAARITSETYAARVQRLRDVGVGTPKTRLSSTSVLSDNYIDELLGKLDRDWYFAETALHKKTDATDAGPGETIV